MTTAPSASGADNDDDDYEINDVGESVQATLYGPYASDDSGKAAAISVAVEPGGRLNVWVIPRDENATEGWAFNIIFEPEAAAALAEALILGEMENKNL